MFTAKEILKGALLWDAYLSSVEGNRRPLINWTNWANANMAICFKAQEFAEHAYSYAQRLNDESKGN